MRRLTRREVLKISALTVAGIILPSSLRDVEATEGEPPVLAIGKFIDRSTGQVYGDDLPILGVTGYHYIVKSGSNIRYYRIDTIQTTNRDYFPFPSIVQDGRLGIRCDDSRFANMLPRTGSSINRIAFPSEDLRGGTYFDQAISAAQANNMRVMAVFNPSWPRDADYYRARVDYCLSKGVLLELGNEMDNTTPGYEFWHEQNYETYAQFIKTCQDYIYQINPDYQPIVGALVDVNNTGKLLTALVNANVNIAHLKYAVHAYQSSEDLPNRLWRMNQFFNQFKIKPKIHCTEIGAQYPYLQKGILVNMLQRAYQTSVESIIIHQLFDHPEGGQPYGFGLVSSDWTITYPVFMQVNAFVRQPYTALPQSTKPPTVSPVPSIKPSKTPTPIIKNGQT